MWDRLRFFLIDKYYNYTTPLLLPQYLDFIPPSSSSSSSSQPTVLSPATTLDTLSLPQTGELGAPTTEETVYTSAVSESLDENLLQVNVSVSQTSEGGASGVTPEITDPSMEQNASGASEWGMFQSLYLVFFLSSLSSIFSLFFIFYIFFILYLLYCLFSFFRPDVVGWAGSDAGRRQ